MNLEHLVLHAGKNGATGLNNFVVLPFLLGQHVSVWEPLFKASVAPLLSWTGGEPLAITQSSYGKGPGYFLFKTAIFPISVFLLLFRMKFSTELENDQYDIFK